MRIVAISDTHGAHDQLQGLYALPEGDVLVHAGDFTNSGHLEEVAAFGVWLAKQTFKHKIVVAGNHDYCFANGDSNEARMLLGDCTYLQDSGCVIDGLQFWGSPWSPDERCNGRGFGKWPSSVLPTAPPSQIDVLVTHGSYAACLRFDRSADGTSRLSTVRLHIYGHNANHASTAKAERSRYVGVLNSQCFDHAFVGHCASVFDIDQGIVKHATAAAEDRYQSYCRRAADAATRGIYRRPQVQDPLPPCVSEQDWLDGFVIERQRGWVRCRVISFRHPGWPEREEMIGSRFFPRGAKAGDLFSFRIGTLPDKSWQIAVWLGGREKRPRVTVLPPASSSVT